jgi:hypothetical protein
MVSISTRESDMTIRQIDTPHLIYNLSQAPYDTYVEALRRQTNLLNNKDAWASKRLSRTEAEYARLLKIIRAYYARSAA